MLRSVIIALAFALAVTAAQAAGIKTYKTVAGAQRHCPNDEVVWANSASTAGVFHVKGTRYYGKTQHGAYVCRKEAEAGGWHAAKNDQ